MPIQSVIEYPNPILRNLSEPVESINDSCLKLILDLKDTMFSFPGCVGLAANQIGSKERVAVVDVSSKIEGSELRVLINPRILHQSKHKILREGCLSIQNLTANVKRAEQVEIEYMDVSGEIIKYQAQGLEAICIQHEIDHLDGNLFIDHVISAKTDIFRRKRYLH